MFIIKCNTTYNYNLRQCPLYLLMINIQPKDTSKGHFYVSLAKSVLRIGAGGSLLVGALVVAGALFITAEILGIIEELV